MQRRERTRHLIELGGLVQKAGLVDLTDDDRATILGGLMDLADRLQGEGGAALGELFRRRGLRAFEAEATAALHHLGDAIDVDEAIDELAVALLVSVFAAAAAILTSHISLPSLNRGARPNAAPLASVTWVRNPGRPRGRLRQAL